MVVIFDTLRKVDMMKIWYLFYNLKNLSSLSKGEELLNIFSKNNFEIEKASKCEPIRDTFDMKHFPEMWLSGKEPDEFAWQTLLFKGSKEISFKCMVSWNINLPLKPEVVNGINLWLNVKKSYFNNNIDKLVALGDDLFTWSEAVWKIVNKVDTKKRKN